MTHAESTDALIARLRAERDLAEAEAARLRHLHEDFSDLKDDRDALEVENEDLKKKIAQLQSELEKTKAEKGAEKEKSSGDIDDMRERLHAAERELRALMLDFSEMEKKAKRRRDELVEVMEDLANPGA